jgi:hypothetical protein
MKVEKVVPGDGLAIPGFLVFYRGAEYDRLGSVHAHEVDEAAVGGISLWFPTIGADEAVEGPITIAMLD